MSFHTHTHTGKSFSPALLENRMEKMYLGLGRKIFLRMFSWNCVSLYGVSVRGCWQGGAGAAVRGGRFQPIPARSSPPTAGPRWAPQTRWRLRCSGWGGEHSGEKECRWAWEKVLNSFPPSHVCFAHDSNWWGTSLSLPWPTSFKFCFLPLSCRGGEWESGWRAFGP